MHIRTGFVIKHKELGLYLDKSMDKHTASLFSAITFRTREDAEHMLNEGHYKPEKPDEYEVVETIERRLEKESLENVQQVREYLEDCLRVSGI